LFVYLFVYFIYLLILFLAVAYMRSSNLLKEIKGNVAYFRHFSDLEICISHFGIICIRGYFEGNAWNAVPNVKNTERMGTACRRERCCTERILIKIFLCPSLYYSVLYIVCFDINHLSLRAGVVSSFI